MWINRLHEAKSLLRHLFTARGPHGVHSPFVYDLITVILRDKRRSALFGAIEQERKRLRHSDEVIEVDDFGAGSRVYNERNRKVSQVARIALQPQSHAQVLGLLARHANAKFILELGTSFGITTAHLAAAIPESRVFTIEGSKSIANKAQSIWSEIGLDAIDSTAGGFTDSLNGVLQRMASVDFVIIDGDHRGEACLRYLETIFPFTHEHTVIVLDDIYWSPSMTEAWQTCISDPRFSLTLDFFDFGVLYRKSGRVKEHFRLARPWR